MNLPGINGLDFQQLRIAGLEIPIIFITAYLDETIKARALSAGAICFLHKPIDLRGRRLIDCLYTALDRGKGTSPVS